MGSPCARKESRAYAANAFLVLQHGLHQFEIVRLCALWDSPEWEKENIRTIVELIDHRDVTEILAEETAAHWQGIGGHILNPSDDPELQALEIEAIQRSNESFSHRQAQKARAELRKAIDETRAIASSPLLHRIMNHESPRQTSCSLALKYAARTEGWPH